MMAVPVMLFEGVAPWTLGSWARGDQRCERVRSQKSFCSELRALQRPAPASNIVLLVKMDGRLTEHFFTCFKCGMKNNGK